MKFNFKIQQYQTDAVDSVVNCFKGQPYIDNVSYRRDIGNKRETQEYSQMSFVNNYDQGTLDFTDDFDSFYKNITYDMKVGKTKRGIKVKSGQPANFYCVSCTPWTTFTAVSSRVVNGGAAFFPIITAGKYDGNYRMPVNITIAHAVADGYHIGLFFEYLQEEVSAKCLLSNLKCYYSPKVNK